MLLNTLIIVALLVIVLLLLERFPIDPLIKQIGYVIRFVIVLYFLLTLVGDALHVRMP